MLDMGTVVGSFRLIRKLGGGGMGTVYLGEHTLIGSKVAVKFLHEHFASNEALVQRFLAEARAVNLIGHENIVNIFDMNVLPPRRHYLVMEYLEGQPLSSLLGRPVAPAVAVPILIQACDALQAAHGHGVIHRDLKPENIFLVRHDRTPHFVKVLDFGIAKLLERSVAPAQTSLGTLLGTPEYMAPEQWTGQPVDGRTDLYALGLIAYLLLTGRRPFPGQGLGELLQAHLKETPPAPHQVNPEVPAALSNIVMRAMAKRPEERFQTAMELRATLEQALGSARPVSPAPTKRATPAPATSRATPPASPRASAMPVASSPSRPPRPLPDDPLAEALLNMLLRRMSSDPYVVLSLPQDATTDGVRQSIHNVRRNLESIAARPLSARQHKDLTELSSRIEKSVNLLALPRQRLEHDAWRGNYAGVAQCFSSELTTSELESLRGRYLLAHPGAEVRERMHASTAASWEGQGEIARALTAYEEALGVDPLNLQLHQRYWSLKRRDPRPGATRPAPGRLQTSSGSHPAAKEPLAPTG
jgi:serine/threonine protein kinase